jgi:multidrug resistance efflux pump
MIERMVVTAVIWIVLFGVGFLVGVSWMWHRASTVPETSIASAFGIVLELREKETEPG